MAQTDKDFLNYYQQFKDKIFNYFWYRVNFNQALAEDLTSEVFLKAFKHFAGFEQDRPFTCWIYTIARNHLLNYYRIAYREVGLEAKVRLATDDWTKINANIEVKRLIKIIEQLDQYHREVLLLKFVDGLEIWEIAQVLAKDQGAVRTQLSRALAILRQAADYE